MERSFLVKKYWKKGRIYAVYLMLLFLAVMLLPVYARDQDETFYYTHVHTDNCYRKENVRREADGKDNGTITGVDTCYLCGGEHHYYAFSAKCSCGKKFDRTGHACINSPYGSNVGSCSNYQPVGNTYHEHPTNVCICGMTEETQVAAITVERDIHTLTAEDVNLKVLAEFGEEVQGTFTDSASSELKVSRNGSYELVVSYVDLGEPRQVTHWITIDYIDNIPPVAMYTANPEVWKEGECVIRVDAYDPEGEGSVTSGIHEQGYSYDKGVTWTDACEKTFRKSAKGVILVRDAASNITEIPYQIVKKSKNNAPQPIVEPPEIPSDESSDSSEETEDVTSERTSEAEEMSSEQESVLEDETSEESKSESVDERVVQVVDIREVSSEEESDSETMVYEQQSRKTKWITKPLGIVSIGLATLIGLLLLLAGYFFLIGLGNIGYIDASGKEVMVGKIAIGRRKNKWNIHLRENLITSLQSRKLVLYLPKWFVKIFAYQTLSIVMPKGIQEFYVEERLTWLLLE